MNNSVFLTWTELASLLIVFFRYSPKLFSSFCRTYQSFYLLFLSFLSPNICLFFLFFLMNLEQIYDDNICSLGNGSSVLRCRLFHQNRRRLFRWQMEAEYIFLSWQTHWIWVVSCSIWAYQILSYRLNKFLTSECWGFILPVSLISNKFRIKSRLVIYLSI